jgi:hypothetical protein
MAFKEQFLTGSDPVLQLQWFTANKLVLNLHKQIIIITVCVKY